MLSKIDLKGQKIGKLLVLKEVEEIIGRDWGKGKPSKRPKRVGGLKWKCKCDCGDIIVRNSYYLNTREFPSCPSCKKIPRRLRPFEYLYNGLINGAKKKNLLITITYEDFLEFTKKEKCHYCSSLLVWILYSIHRKDGKRGDGFFKNKTGYNLDRKNNLEGYSVLNCVLCCARCNLSKANRYTYKEWLQIGKFIYALNNPKDYETVKTAMFERDGWKCRFCQNRSNLTPHHIEYRSSGGDNTLQNLITLCISCHNAHHQKCLLIDVVDGEPKFTVKKDWRK